MINLRKKFIEFFCLTLAFSLSTSAFGQSVSVSPKSILPMGIVLTGNTVKGKCNGLSKDFVKLTIQPSCYGANLRGGGSVLDPNKGNVGLDLTITNKGQAFSANVEFPNQITWPENYGQTCGWNNVSSGGSVTCDLSGINVNYNCTYKSDSWFLNDYLDCRRVSDNNGDGALNLTIKCGFLYSWSGQNYAAVNSYQKIESVANCGIQNKNIDLSTAVTATSSVAPASLEKYAKRGKVTIDYNGLKISKINVLRNSATGQFEFSGSRSSVTASFYQVKDGSKVPLTQKVEAGFDEYEECLDIKAAFLGQNQFCGSFYSPLMLFFDKKKPLFVGRSSFPLIAGEKMVAWPEKNAPGYFLALDESGKKSIVKSSQLFGDGHGFDNGFLALGVLDSNKDQQIDAKDEKFNKLVLWQDKNGNGVSEASEVFSLSDKLVTKISLSYKDDRRKSYGRNAEARQYSVFSFGDKGAEGEIVDIWFAPIKLQEPKK